MRRIFHHNREPKKKVQHCIARRSVQWFLWCIAPHFCPIRDLPQCSWGEKSKPSFWQHWWFFFVFFLPSCILFFFCMLFSCIVLYFFFCNDWNILTPAIRYTGASRHNVTPRYLMVLLWCSGAFRELIKPPWCRETPASRTTVRGEIPVRWKMHSVHTEKCFRNLIKSNRNQIVFTIFRLIWNSKRTLSVCCSNSIGAWLIQSIAVWFNKIPKRLLYVYLSKNR